MSGSPPRKSTLKRGVGARELVNVNGRAIAAAAGPRRLMFANATQVRPFNFRNSATESATVNFNSGAALVNGKNARGNAPRIGQNDPRANPEFAEAMGTNLGALQSSMIQNRATRAAGINRPTLNAAREAGINAHRRGAKEARLMAAQYELGHPVPELNQLVMEGANNAYIADEVEELKSQYAAHMGRNAFAAYRAAQVNSLLAGRIANEAAGGPRSRRTRRNRRSRKTRRSRK